VFGVRTCGAALSKVIPKDETTAVADASLVGRVGTIVIGTARVGRPAEARIRDEHGATHYVMVEPEEPEQSFAAGASVLLVRHVSGRRFQAINNPRPELL
jgi:Inner membrane protein YqiJ, OB-fold